MIVEDFFCEKVTLERGPHACRAQCTSCALAVATANTEKMRSLFNDKPTGARFSPCRRWRYALWRTWDQTKPHVTFLMMNPSDANEVDNDPTVARCQVRAGKWAELGWWDVGGVKVVNAFAWVETESRKLAQRVREGVNIVGPDNDAAIVEACLGAAIVVCGWGLPGHQLLGRGPAVLKLLRQYGVDPHAFKVNADGSPKHPLYVGYDVRPMPF